MKKEAFTLAEVLTALVIIGIIAAITIPPLIQRTNKQEYVSALQKTYSALSQAASMIIAENGSPECNDGGWLCSNEDAYNMFKKYLNNSKDCDSATGCFEQYDPKIKLLNGNYESPQYNTKGYPKLILAGGMQILFVQAKNQCSNTGAGCVEILADINGMRKPNQLGRDLFLFRLHKTGLIPGTCNIDSCTGGEGKGWGCACKVLREGAMNY